ncbi:MAG TPA: N-acetylmuramoyl-L-alanine amidase [Actinomycetales bacterium]|nr:N-acetylmuramoyl-L-alanine amidase [Actinomycetales bacterium]
MSAGLLLRRDDTGPAVLDVRDRLTATGDLRVARTGPDDTGDVYTEDVERAVRSFQQRRGLLVDGIVGPQTYRALEATRWQLGDRILLHTPGHLMEGDDVAALQERLLSLGFPCGRVDGVFGWQTDAALRQLQRGVGLQPDGLAGPHTLRALNQLGRAVTGGRPHSLREADLVRAAGPNLSGRVIVLDPGHSSDPDAAHGAAAHGLVESDAVLDLARRIEGRLAAVGVQVVLTRALTGNPTERERADLANAVGADLLLSLHCEALPDRPQANGIACFFYGHPDQTGAWSGVGEHLATLVQREIVARTDLTDCRTHARTWDLLRMTRMPAVRIEVGHLTNEGDAHRLSQPAFRDTIAEAVVVAVQRLYLADEDDTATGTLNVADVLARASRT